MRASQRIWFHDICIIRIIDNMNRFWNVLKSQSTRLSGIGNHPDKHSFPTFCNLLPPSTIRFTVLARSAVPPCDRYTITTSNVRNSASIHVQEVVYYSIWHTYASGILECNPKSEVFTIALRAQLTSNLTASQFPL